MGEFGLMEVTGSCCCSARFATGFFFVGDGLDVGSDHLPYITLVPVLKMRQRNGECVPLGTGGGAATLIADQGPERVGVRTSFGLTRPTDTVREYVGDGIFEVSSRPDDAVFAGVGLRVHRLPGLTQLWEAGLQLSVGGRKGPVLGPSGNELAGSIPLAEADEWAILQTETGWLGLYWGRDPKGWCEPLGGEGLWPAIGDGKTAPFFHGWENYLRQWHGPHGWRARETAGLVVGRDSLTLAWHQGSDLPVEGSMHFSGAVALAWGESEAEVRAKMAAPASPLAPSAEGAAVSGFDHLEGSYRFRRTGRKALITLPPDPLARRTVVRVDGPPAAAVACKVNGQPARAQLVSVGRVDDPYGPHEGRPDSNGRPVLAAFERPAERVELGVTLAKDAPTTVEVSESEGVSLSYLAQDDRRELLLFSDLDPRPLGRLSLADLKLRDLRLPGRERPAVSLLPLYWFLMNAPSAFHSANRLDRWELAENGPGAVRLTLSALNPGEKVRSTVSLNLPAPSADALRMEISCRLEVLGEFPVPHFQFCNLFPEPSRMPDDWQHAETLAASADDLWVVENRRPTGGASTVEGKRFREFRAPLFLSQYASPAGSFALLVTAAEPAGQQLGYELCRCWLDNHLFAIFPEGGPKPGDSFEVRYQLVLWGDGAVTRDQVKQLARAGLASGRLEV